MKKLIRNSILIAGIMVSAFVNALAQPAWTVNPNDYVYSMTITGKITTDGYLSTDPNDMIAAFIDGECRGVTNVKKTQLNDYFVFLMVYSNNPTGTVSFKIYDASENMEFTVKQTINFTVNDIIGSISNPFVFTASTLNSEAKILTFSAPDQQGQTFFNGNQISLQIVWNGNVNAIAPSFTTSVGAKVMVNGVEQVSGVTVNNFSSPVEYVVESADLSQTTLYTVSITLANDIPVDLTLSNNEVDENDPSGFIGTLKAISENTAKVYYYSLLNMPGIDNSNFYIEGNELKYHSPLNYEYSSAHKVYILADDKKGGIIKRYFLINVNDKNDAPQQLGIKNESLAENMPPDTNAGELFVVDEDAGDIHTFALIAGNSVNDADNQLFYIAGNLLKTQNQLSYTKGEKFNIFVKVTDSGGASKSEALVLGTDSEGIAPYNILLSNNTVPDVENPPVFVGTLKALDADQITGHRFYFEPDSLLGADNGYFNIVDDSLFLTDPQPVADKGVYEIYVTAKDSSNKVYSKNFRITISEGEQPTDFYLSKNTVPENKAFNTVVGFFDSQKLQAGEYNFTLPLEVDLDRFANQDFNIVGRTLLTSKIFDFENQKSALLQVVVSNGATSLTEDITVNVTDENDTPSGIRLSNVIISESAVLNSVLGDFMADDQDTADTHEFSLVIGNGINDESNSIFKIEGNQLVLAKPLDYESKEFHNILVRVADNRRALFEQGLRLQIADANDAPYFLSTPVGYVLQDEVYVYAIKVSDSEGDSVSFQFNGLPDWLHFSPGSAILSGSPGNDMIGDYSFNIHISDGNKERTQPVIISVINVNDAPELNYYLEKQVFFSGLVNSVQIPADLITDPDLNDELKFTLSTENNSAIPAWLIFDSKTMLLSGNPPTEAQGIYALKLTATDKAKLREWMVFQLEVALPTASIDFSDERLFLVYPNPVSDKLNYKIPMKTEPANISITNVSGKLVESFVFEPGATGTISVIDKSPGIYYLKFVQGEKQQTEKIVKL
jgi:hypothetical protein